MSSEHIWNKPLTKRQRAVLERIADAQAKGDDSGIDFSDVPQIPAEKLAQAVKFSKRLVAVRLDRDVFEWIRSFGHGYSTRINNVLRAVMEQQSASAKR